MAWTAPMTAVTGVVFTASQFNLYVRDNLLADAVGKATTQSRLIVVSSAGNVVERIPARDVNYDYGWRNSATYGNTLDGDGLTQSDVPQIVVNVSSKALVSFGGFMSNTIQGLGTYIACDVSGATNEAANDTNSVYCESANPQDGHRMTYTTIYDLNPGAHLFTLKYRTTAGGGISEYDGRMVCAVPF